MKSIKIAIGTLAVALLLNSSVSVADNGPVKKVVVAKPTVLTADPAATVIKWNAKKVGGEHTGTVKLTKGALQVDKNKLVGGEFTMDMTSIAEEGNNARLTTHLKSDDFFSAEKNPTSTFKITKATPIAGAKAGEPNYTIAGDLSIKGTTKPLTFPATVTVTGNKAEASAKFPINRIDYDIKFRSGIINTAADKIIEDNFTIDLKLVAAK